MKENLVFWDHLLNNIDDKTCQVINSSCTFVGYNLSNHIWTCTLSNLIMAEWRGEEKQVSRWLFHLQRLESFENKLASRSVQVKSGLNRSRAGWFKINLSHYNTGTFYDKCVMRKRFWKNCKNFPTLRKRTSLSNLDIFSPFVWWSWICTSFTPFSHYTMLRLVNFSMYKTSQSVTAQLILSYSLLSYNCLDLSW